MADKKNILIIAVIILGAVATSTFLLFRQNKQYQSNLNVPPNWQAPHPIPPFPPYPPVPSDIPKPPPGRPEPPAIATIDEIKNGLLGGYLAQENLSLPNHLKLTNGGGNFIRCDGQDPAFNCEKINHIIVLSHITRRPDRNQISLTSYDSTWAYAAILDHQNASKRTSNQYLVLLSATTQSGNTNSYIKFQSSILLPEGIKVSTINLTEKEKIKIDSNIGEKKFFVSSERNRNFLLYELTQDESAKIYRRYGGGDAIPDFTFVYPIEFIEGYYMSTNRSIDTEGATGYRPVYFAESCNLEQTFSDYAATFSRLDTIVRVSAHAIKTQKVYLTSSLYGYDPADWGQIKQTISIPDYVYAITAARPLPQKQVEKITVQGISGRHILPYTVGRPCNERTYEQYQWVVNNHIVNVIIEEPISQPLNAAYKSYLVKRILDSFKIITQ